LSAGGAVGCGESKAAIAGGLWKMREKDKEMTSPEDERRTLV